MQIVRLLTRENYVPKWDSFAIYWIGILLRNYKTEFASNSVAHASVEFIPEYYLEAKKHFDDFMKIEFEEDLGDLTVKIIYEILMKESYVKPKVMVKFPKHNYKYIWKIVNNVFMNSESLHIFLCIKLYLMDVFYTE